MVGSWGNLFDKCWTCVRQLGQIRSFTEITGEHFRDVWRATFPDHSGNMLALPEPTSLQSRRHHGPMSDLAPAFTLARYRADSGLNHMVLEDFAEFGRLVPTSEMRFPKPMADASTYHRQLPELRCRCHPEVQWPSPQLTSHQLR